MTIGPGRIALVGLLGLASAMGIGRFAFTPMLPLMQAAGQLSLPQASALTPQECSAKYQAAKTAGTLGGQKWNDFRKAECGPGASAKPETPAAAPNAWSAITFFDSRHVPNTPPSLVKL